MMQMNNN